MPNLNFESYSLEGVVRAKQTLYLAFFVATISLAQEQQALTIEELAAKMEDLDMSVDFLSAAMLGVDPQAVSGAQSGVGRGARATKAFNAPSSPPVDEAHSKEDT